MDCVSILEKKGYDLKGYSFDTYYYLRENNLKSSDECEALLMLLEREYG